jgi:hypothetical protein
MNTTDNQVHRAMGGFDLGKKRNLYFDFKNNPIDFEGPGHCGWYAEDPANPGPDESNSEPTWVRCIGEDDEGACARWLISNCDLSDPANYHPDTYVCHDDAYSARAWIYQWVWSAAFYFPFLIDPGQPFWCREDDYGLSFM